MRATRHQAIATLVAFALATGSTAPVAFAKSSGFSSSRSSSSSSSSSRSSSGSSSSRYSSSSSSSSSSSGASYGRSYSSSSYKSSSYDSSARSPANTSNTSSTPSTPSKSGFSSSGSRKVIAATALGGALYAAQSSHDAAATLNSSQSSRSSADGSSSLDRDTSGNTRSYGTRSDASPSYSAPVRSAPPPVVAPQSSGNNGLLLGYMLGRSSSPRETVVVQQPAARAVDSAAAPMYRHASSGNATPDTSTAASDVQAETVDQPRAMTAKQATKESKHPFLDAIVLTVMLACSVYLVVALCKRVRRAWLVRKARYASHTNYRL